MAKAKKDKAEKAAKVEVVIDTKKADGTLKTRREMFMEKVEQIAGDSKAKTNIMFLDGSVKAEAIPVIPTGIPEIDYASGVGGIPKGRIIEIIGPEMAGKTTLSLCIADECKKLGGVTLFIDAEHALDRRRVEQFNLDGDLAISQPDTGEEALNLIEEMCTVCDLIIVDSVAALVPSAEVDGDVGDSHMGLQARMMSQALRKMVSKVSKSNCVVIFLNQIRSKIGVMFGNPEVGAGGNALKFYNTMKIDVRRKDVLKEGETAYANLTRVYFAKNKVAAPFTEAFFDLYYDASKIKMAAVLSFAVKKEIISKSGTWYSFKDERLGQGMKNVVNFMDTNPDMFTEIQTEVAAFMDTFIKSNTKPALPQILPEGESVIDTSITYSSDDLPEIIAEIVEA